MHTIPSLKKDIKNLGLSRGMSVIVHTSFSKVGDVNGGPAGLILALEETVTQLGNIVMPTMSSPPVVPKYGLTARAKEIAAYVLVLKMKVGGEA